MPFPPRGEAAEWRMLYDEFRKHGPGQVVTLQRLSEVLGRDFLAGGRAALRRTIRELETAGSRTLVCARGAGCRTAAAEHEGLARLHCERSRRQLGRAAARARSA
jgi:hypothetical protein